MIRSKSSCARFFHGLIGGVGERDLVTAAFQHHFHSDAGVDDDRRPRGRGDRLWPSALVRPGVGFCGFFFGSGTRRGASTVLSVTVNVAPWSLPALCDRDFSPVRGHHRLRDCEPKSETAESPRNRALALLERVENLSLVRFFDADAGVGDPDFDFVRGRIQRFDDDTPFGRGKFHAVLDQVPKDLLQARRVAFDVSCVLLADGIRAC